MANQKLAIIKNAEASIVSIKEKIKDFTKGEAAVKKNFGILGKIKIAEIKDTDKRNELLEIVKTAKREVKTYGSTRLELTRPVENLKKEIIAHERSVIAETNSKISEIEVIIADYDYKVEQERLAELERLQEEQERKEREEREELLKIERGQELIDDLNSDIKNEVTEMIANDDYPLLIELEKQYRAAFKKVKKDNFLHRVEDAKVIYQLAVDRLGTLKAQVKKLHKIKIDKELAGEAERKRLEQQEENERKQLRAKNEAAKADLEKVEIDQERTLLDQERKLNFGSGGGNISAIKELEKSKLKNLTRGFEIEIADIELVPMKFITKVLNNAAAKKWIKENGKPFDGIKVKLKNNQYL